MSAAIASRHSVYEPRGAALDLWRSRAPEILMDGPAGTGKTRGILQKIVALADKYPRSRHLICRKTRASMTESVLVTLEEKVFPFGHPITRGPQRMHRQSYQFPNGSTMVVGGLDTPERTFSTEYDTVSVFEATEASEDEYEKLQRSLRNGRMGYHQQLADVNPTFPQHWINQRANTPRMLRLLSRHEDNPELYDAAKGEWTARGREYIGRLDSLTGVRRLRLRLGLWAAAEGMVYEGWDPALHLIDPFPIPAEWRRYWVVDFGYTNPFCWQAWAEDPDGRLYRYREIYQTQRLVEDHAKEILRVTKDEPRPVALICDHDAEDRATLERHLKVKTTPAWKAVKPGLEAVMARLRKAGDGQPRLFLMRDSLVERDSGLVAAKKPTCSDEEIDGYVWPKGVDGKPLKEQPVKEGDHGMDDWRYLVAHVDRVGRAPQRKAKVYSG